MLLAVGVLHGFLIFAIKKTPARECILAAFISLIAFYGAIGVFLAEFIGWHAFTVLWLVIHLAFMVYVYRQGEQKRFAKYLNSAPPAIGLLICLQVFWTSTTIAKDAFRVDDLMGELVSQELASQELASHETVSRRTVSPTELPDIYYIIVDAYAREDVLREAYDYDNHPFINSLRERGFYVGESSHSNYHLTELSLASSMNMTHLAELKLDRFNTRIPVREMIANSSVVRFLGERGYSTVGFESGKSDTECKHFGRYIPIGGALNDYEDVLYHRSMLPGLLELSRIPIRSAARRHGDRTIETLAKIPTAVSETLKPSFVFSHLLAPHPPFVKDRLGNDVDFHGHYLLADAEDFTSCYDYDLDVYQKAYRNQVAFINTKLDEMIDRIQNADRKSIIIIQADHGPRMGLGSESAADESPEKVRQRHREAFSILNAIYVPDDFQPTFYSDMTPVNTFRIILNEIFDARFNLLADESYYECQYEFDNVTALFDVSPPPPASAATVAQNH